MAIINNNVQNVKFLRNGNVFTPVDNKTARQVALETMNGQLDLLADGTAILGRYQESNGTVKTLVGFAYISGSTKTLTVFDTEGSEADVEALREQMENTFGTGVTTANTATAQLAALSGNGQSTSAETSVEGAKRYADELKNQMDYSGVTTGAGVYVTNVTEADGVVSATTATLPTVADEASAKTFVTSVSENIGEISVEKGTITSSGETIVLTDNADGGVNFEVNIDGASIVQDQTSKKIKVADSALTQYFGDEKTIHAEVDATTNKKTFNTLLKIVKNANPSETEVKEEYFLADADGTAITGADTIKIYKDSHIVSITYITDSGDTHYQNLEYKYIDVSGATKTEYVDISSLVLEAEFASGVTITNHVAHGVVDPTSESFLTVGAEGFKISGVSGLVENAIDALDADISGNSTHVTVGVVEEDGVITAVTVSEDNIANADDLAELSGKTITVLTSANESIAIGDGTAQGDGTIGIDLITDADKIQMSGFSASNTTALSGIAESDSIATAFEKTNAVITENERVTAEALTDLDDRIDTVSGDVETIKAEYISGVSVNNVAVTPTNKVAPIAVSSSQSAATATNNEAIVVTTDNATGAITLGIANIDCGYYN